MNQTGRENRTALASRVAPGARGAGWVADGFRHFREDWQVWLLVSVLTTVGALIVQLLAPVLGTLLVFLLMPVMVGGLMSGLSEREHGRALTVADLFRAFGEHHAGALITVGIVSFMLNVAALVAAIVVTVLFASADFLTALAQNEDMLAAGRELTFSLGLMTGLLLYVALLIPITMLVWFAPALVVLEGESAAAAMRHSFVGCLRNFVPYLVYGVVGVVVFPLLVLFTLGLGALVLVPVGLASIYSAYKDIFHRQGAGG